MKATRRDIEFYQENMDRLQSEKDREAARAASMEKELRELREERAEDRRQMKDLLCELKESNRKLDRLEKSLEKKDARIEELTAKVMELTGKLANADYAAFLNRSRRFKRSSEQSRLLNRRDVKGRDEEKDDFDGTPPSGGTDDDTAAEPAASPSTGKNKSGKHTQASPSTCDEKIVHKYTDYFQLPEGARLMMRDGVPDKTLFYFIEHRPARNICHVYEVVRYIDADNETFCSSLPPEVRAMTPVEGCPLTAELLAMLITYRYGLHLPEYRVREALKEQGLYLSNSVIDRYYGMAEEKLMQLLETVLHREVSDARYMMIDETTAIVCVKDEVTGAKAYMKKYIWAFFNKEKKLVEYVYEGGSRSRDVIRKFFRTLDSLDLTITTDGYAAYNLFDTEECAQVVHCGCMTHVRRYFVDSLASSHDAAMEMIEAIEALFTADSLGRYLSEKERLEWRHKEVRPLLLRIRQLAERYKADPGLMSDDILRKAVTYTLNQWPTLENIMKSGIAELSNNLSEQRVKPIKLNLKNSQVIGSEDAAKRHCVAYSLVESCRLLGISVMQYFRELFARLSHTPKDQRGELLPHRLAASLPKISQIPIFARSL